VLGTDRAKIATAFHNTITSVISTMAGELRTKYGIHSVALSGGTFQNNYLLNRTTGMLTAAGLAVCTNHHVPCNDGGISLGQAYLVRERLKKCGMRIADCEI
jgi:hydrogenase maturation protein HypF